MSLCPCGQPCLASLANLRKTCILVKMSLFLNLSPYGPGPTMPQLCILSSSLVTTKNRSPNLEPFPPSLGEDQPRKGQPAMPGPGLSPGSSRNHGPVKPGRGQQA